MKKWFDNLPLRSKLMISHLLLIAIPTIVIIFFFYSHLYGLIVDDTIRQEQALSQQTSTTINATMEQITTVSTAIRGNAYLAALFNTAKNPTQLEELLSDDASKKSFVSSIISQIDGKLITDVRIYTDQIPASSFADTPGSEILHPLSDTGGAYWHGIFASTSKYSLFCPSFYLTKDELTNCGSLAYIERVFASTSPADSPTYLAVYFSQDTLEEILGKNTSVSDSVSYIINERDTLVASSNVSLSGTFRMDYDTVRNIGQSYDEFTTKNVLGENVYTGCYALDNTDWYMVSIVPSKPVLRKGNSVIINFSILYLALLAIAFIIVTWLSHTITSRVETVSAQMRKVREGPPVRINEPEVHDEIGDLTATYNYMTDEMNQLICDRETASEELRISEVRALQAQINPHFLYNTMEMINWLSQTGQQKEVTEAIQALSRFYKLTLSKKDIFGTIASETEHVALYVQLQNMRFNEHIHFFVDIPEELMDYRIPKLTFQPVVENAIQHGILEKESGEGTIVLTGWLEDEDVVILISDDGIGIEKNQIPSILSGIRDSGSGSNIGVSNTHRRLQIIYGDEYGLSYRSTPGEGTEVQIRIQKSMKHDSD